MATEEKRKRMRIVPLALQEIVGSGGFTHSGVPGEDEEASPPDEEAMPEGVTVEDSTEETVVIRDPYTNQETDKEQPVHLFKIKDLNRLTANLAYTGTRPARGEAAGAESEKVDVVPPRKATEEGESRAEKKTPRSESEGS